MRTTLLSVSILFSIGSILGQGSWTQRANFPGGLRCKAVGFSIGNVGYVGTGESNCSPTNPMNDFWEYNPMTNIWTQRTNFGGIPRSLAVGFSIGNKGYIGTGVDVNGNKLNDLWEFDPGSNAWTQKTSLPGPPRYSAIAFSLGTKGYIGLGDTSNFTSTGLLNDFWEFDPGGNIWLQKSNFPASGRVYAVSFSLSSKGYVVTGANATSFRSDLWEYDAVSDSWTQKTSFIRGKAQATGFSIGSGGYIVTGVDSPAVPMNELWAYDQTTNNWYQKANLPVAMRIFSTAFSVGTKGYVGLGDWGVSYDDFWEYSPDTIFSVQENQYRVQTTVYPNPITTSGLITLSQSISKGKCRIYDVQGRGVKEMSVSGLKCEINKDEFASGIYFYQILSLNQTIASGRFVIL